MESGEKFSLYVASLLAFEVHADASFLVNAPACSLMQHGKLLLIVLVCFCNAAQAGDARGIGGWYLSGTKSEEDLGIGPKLAKCLATLEGGSVAGRRQCLGAENQRQDKRMNTAYQKALTRLGPARQELLRQSQRAWLKLVGSQCELEAGPPTGGTDWTDELVICDLHWRAYRAMFLESLDE